MNDLEDGWQRGTQSLCLYSDAVEDWNAYAVINLSFFVAFVRQRSPAAYRDVIRTCTFCTLPVRVLMLADTHSHMPR